MKAICVAMMAVGLGAGSVMGQVERPELRGNYFGRTAFTISDGSGSMTGTIQQTVNNFRSRPRGTIQSSMVLSGAFGFSLASWDVLQIAGGAVTMQTTFLNPCGCGGEESITISGPVEVRRRGISYSASSADGSYTVVGLIQLTRNGMVRTETRTIYDPDFDETTVFTFSSVMYPQGRRAGRGGR